MNLKHIFSQIKRPTKQEVRNAFLTFSKKQKIIFFAFLALFFVSLVATFSQYLIQPFQHETPVFGGVWKEGSFGTPRFINPVLAFSNADTDLESLVFAGLTKKTSDGSIVLDLAEDFSVSKDNLVYTFTLREDARFHDKTPILAQDLIFTISAIQNPEIKSPQRIYWDNIKVDAINERTVRFTLSQPFIGFLEQTTLGILPSHIWEDVSAPEFAFSPFNTNPIGSGPYKITHTKKTKNGTIEVLTLKTTKTYAGEKPFLKTVVFHFFDEEKRDQAFRALKKGTIDAIHDVRPGEIEKLPKHTISLYPATFQKMFGIFFNQNNTNSLVANKDIRQAISLAINRSTIIETIFSGFGDPLVGPLPTTLSPQHNISSYYDPARAEAILATQGWVKNTEGYLEKNGVLFELTLITAKTPELIKTGELIKKDLGNIGIAVTLENVDLIDLNQNIVRPRRFEMLLFGITLNHESDIFAFWHSSQTSDPGLNISSYKNKTIDSILANILQTFDIEKRLSLYRQFETEFLKDTPAIFLYSPQLIYAVRDTLHNVELSPIINSSERLLDIEAWYTETNHTIRAIQ